MDAEEIVESILVKYSSPDGRETCCSKAELKRDLVRIMEGFIRERDSIQEMHDAWLWIQKDREKNKTFMQKLFA